MTSTGSWAAHAQCVQLGPGNAETVVRLEAVPSVGVNVRFAPLGLFGDRSFEEFAKRQSYSAADLGRVDAWCRRVRVVVKDTEGASWFDGHPEVFIMPPWVNFTAPAGSYELIVLDGEKTIASRRLSIPGIQDIVVLP